MNYKFLFPTFRNRYLFIKNNLSAYEREKFERGLNLGTGEGDYDHLISLYCKQLIGCDINEQDIAFARQLNANVAHLEYRVEDALDLNFDPASFDLLVSVEVLEHVGKPRQMVREIGRVLRPGGMAFITFPRYHFPFTYDPINKLMRRNGKRAIAQGAYAFGHEYLIKTAEFEEWCRENNLEIIQARNLSGSLIALLEMYWTGIVQRLFKDNSENINVEKGTKITLRPSNKTPFFTFLTDGVIALDHFLFGKSRNSVGKGYVLRKAFE